MKRFLFAIAALAAALLPGGCMWCLPPGDPPDNPAPDIRPTSFSRTNAVNAMISRLTADAMVNGWAGIEVGYDAGDLTRETWLGVRGNLGWRRGGETAPWQLFSRLDGALWTLELTKAGKSVWLQTLEVYDLP